VLHTGPRVGEATTAVEIPSPEIGSFVSVDHRLARNATWLLVAQIATLASGLAILVAISRLLTPEDLGRWRFSQAILAYLLVLADTGLTSFAIREIASRATPVATFGWTMLVLRLSIATASLGAIIIALAVGSQSPNTMLVTAIMGASAIASALSAGYVLQAREDFRGVASIRMTVQVVGAIGAVAGLVITASLQGAAFAVLLAAVLGAVVTDHLVARTGALGGGLSTSAAARFLRGAAPFIGAGLAVQVIFNADAFLIQLLQGERDLGLYAAPYAIAGYSLVIGGALMGAAYPRMARASEPAVPDDYIGELSAVMGTLSLPIAIGGMVTAEQLLMTLFGPVYVDRWPILVVLMTLPMVGFMNMTLWQTMAAIGLQRGEFMTALAAASVNVVLNLLAIPRLGIMGAAIVAAATEMVTLGLYARLAVRFGVRVPVLDYLGSLPAALLMGTAVVVLRALGVTTLLVLLPAGVFVYAGIQAIRPSRGARALRRVLARGPVGRSGAA
jgi:O-antigen/teichoic acid export membrane protein